MAIQKQFSPFTIIIHADKAATCLAGYDHHGPIERIVKPSELTDRQRQTLVNVNFTLGETNTGAPINGTETVTELLDRAADKIEADKAKEQSRIDEAVEILTRRIIEASPYNPHHIHEKTGVVEFEQNKHALIQVDALNAFKKWHDSYFFRCVGDNYFVGEEKTVSAIRERVLSNPDVAERLASLEKVADHIQEQLDEAKQIRDRIEQERRAAVEQKHIDTERRRKEQLAEFVLGLDELSQRKWAADLLPESEILERYTNTVFLNLDFQFKAVDRAELKDEVRRYYADEFDIHNDCAVRFLDRKPEELDDDAFLLADDIATAAKTQYPGAKAEILLLAGYLEDYSGGNDPELITPILRVTVQEGEIEFSREYYLEIVRMRTICPNETTEG